MGRMKGQLERWRVGNWENGKQIQQKQLNCIYIYMYMCINICIHKYVYIYIPILKEHFHESEIFSGIISRQ